MATMTRPFAIKTLRRRLEFLESRLEHIGSSGGSSYDVNEAKSLRWALDILEPMVAEDDLRTRINEPEFEREREPEPVPRWLV